MARVESAAENTVTAPQLQSEGNGLDAVRDEAFGKPRLTEFMRLGELGKNGVITPEDIKEFRQKHANLSKEENELLDFLEKENNFDSLKQARPINPVIDSDKKGISFADLNEATQVFKGLDFVRNHRDIADADGTVSYDGIEKYLSTHKVSDEDARALRKLEYYEPIPTGDDVQQMAEKLFSRPADEMPAEKQTPSPESEAAREERETNNAIELYKQGRRDEETTAEILLSIKHHHDANYRPSQKEIDDKIKELHEKFQLVFD